LIRPGEMGSAKGARELLATKNLFGALAFIFLLPHKAWMKGIGVRDIDVDQGMCDRLLGINGDTLLRQAPTLGARVEFDLSGVALACIILEFFTAGSWEPGRVR
jgi:hypothetical protein